MKEEAPFMMLLQTGQVLAVHFGSSGEWFWWGAKLGTCWLVLRGHLKMKALFVLLPQQMEQA